MTNILKKALRSKTIRLSLLQALIGLVVIFQTDFPAVGGIAMAKSMLDIYIRTLTTSALNSK